MYKYSKNVKNYLNNDFYIDKNKYLCKNRGAE